jgi:purine-binding chemotaxis protein CheW
MSDAAALREAFDRQFAAAPPDDARPVEPLVGLRAGEEAYAFRLPELAGIQATPRLLFVPGGPPAWMGLAGLRGKLVPVYDLATLLGQPPADAPARWIALSREEPALAVAFEALDGLLYVEAGAVRPGTGAGAAVPEVVAHEGRLRGVIRLAALKTLIEAHAGLNGDRKENPS